MYTRTVRLFTDILNKYDEMDRDINEGTCLRLSDHIYDVHPILDYKLRIFLITI